MKKFSILNIKWVSCTLYEYGKTYCFRTLQLSTNVLTLQCHIIKKKNYILYIFILSEIHIQSSNRDFKTNMLQT